MFNEKRFRINWPAIEMNKVKFRFSEKAAKCGVIFHLVLVLTYVMSNKKRRLLKQFVAFSEIQNFSKLFVVFYKLQDILRGFQEKL